MLCFNFKKRHIKGEKHIAAMDFAEFLRKSNVPQKSNFIMADYYAVDFTEFIVIFVKVDEMYSILKSLLAIRYWLRDEGGLDGQSFCWSLPFNVYIFTTLKGKLHFLVTISYYFI